MVTKSNISKTFVITVDYKCKMQRWQLTKKPGFDKFNQAAINSFESMIKPNLPRGRHGKPAGLK
jgi:hypothetical protein